MPLLGREMCAWMQTRTGRRSQGGTRKGQDVFWSTDLTDRVVDRPGDALRERPGESPRRDFLGGSVRDLL